MQRDQVQKMMTDWIHDNFDLRKISPLHVREQPVDPNLNNERWYVFQNQMELIIETDVIMIRITWIFLLQKVRLYTWYPKKPLIELDVADPDFFSKLKTVIDQRIDDYIQKFPLE